MNTEAINWFILYSYISIDPLVHLQFLLVFKNVAWFKNNLLPYFPTPHFPHISFSDEIYLLQ